MTTQTSGHCPKCNSQDLDYGGWEVFEESLGYEIRCTDCGFKGWEIYNVDFSHFEDEKRVGVESAEAPDPERFGTISG